MKLRKIFKIMVAAVVITSVAGGAAYAYSLYAATDKALASVASSGSVADILQAEALDGESTGQVNILVAGNSTDDAGHSGAALTDSIMVANIDIATKKVSIISIPRDLWVSYGGSYSKINAVYTTAGMTGLKQVVQDVTGLTINHTVLINYTALKVMIDTVGGIDVTIESPDSRGIYDPMIGFSIGNGVQHLSGEQALLLARSRNDPTYDGRVAYGLPNGDFDRQMYQRKIVQALITKVTASSTIVNPSTLTKLISSLDGNVTTDLNVGQIRRLFDLGTSASAVESISIRTDSDEQYLLANYTSQDGQSALIPSAGVGSYSAIQAYLMATLPVATASN